MCWMSRIQRDLEEQELEELGEEGREGGLEEEEGS